MPTDVFVKAVASQPINNGDGVVLGNNLVAYQDLNVGLIDEPDEAVLTTRFDDTNYYKSPTTYIVDEEGFHIVGEDGGVLISG